MNREDVAMDLTVQNVEILRKEVQAAKLLLSECDKVLEEDGGVYIELRAFLSGKMSADDVIALLASQQGEQCEHSENIRSDGVCIECGEKVRGKHPEQAEGAQGEREEFATWWNHAAQWELRNSCAMGWGEKVWRASRAALAQPSPAPEVVYAVFADNGNIRCWAMDRNHGSLKALEVEGCTVVPLQSVAVAQAGQVPEEWRAALQRLEDACDKRSALFSAEAYRVAIQTPGFGDAMSDLDDAREAARDLLAAASAQGGDA